MNNNNAENMKKFEQFERGDPEQEQPDTPLDNRVIIFRVIIVLLALLCCSMCIFILAKSSQYFSYLFSLTTQIQAKTYLNSNYKSFLASLYITIMGFVLVGANTIIFFYKFSQKDKILIFHICYFLTILISGIVALTDYDYLDKMTLLQTTTGAACSANGYINECLLSKAFIDYRGNFIMFFIIFLIGIVLFATAYHIGVLKMEEWADLERQSSQQGRLSVRNANKQNQTLITEIADIYML